MWSQVSGRLVQSRPWLQGGRRWEAASPISNLHTRVTSVPKGSLLCGRSVTQFCPCHMVRQVRERGRWGWQDTLGSPPSQTSWALQGPTEPGHCSGAQEQPSLNPLANVWSTSLCGLGVSSVDGTPWDPGSSMNGLWTCYIHGTCRKDTVGMMGDTQNRGEDPRLELQG